MLCLSRYLLQAEAAFFFASKYSCFCLGDNLDHSLQVIRNHLLSWLPASLDYDTSILHVHVFDNW